MLKVKRVLIASNVAIICDENLITDAANSDHSIRVIESASGYIQDTFSLSALPKTFHVASSQNIHFAVFYEKDAAQTSAPANICNFYCYDFTQSSADQYLIARFSVTIPINPSGSRVLDACNSLCYPELFFFVTHEEYLYAMKYKANRSIKVSLPIKLSKLNAKLYPSEKKKGSIVSIRCHPVKPIIFIIYSHGSIQVS